MLHPPLCNRRQSLNQNRGEHRPSHRHDWRRTVVQIGDAGVKVAIEYQCPVAGGERRVDREQVRSALVVVPALPAASCSGPRHSEQSDPVRRAIGGKQRSGLVAPCSGSRHSVPVSSRAIGQAAQWWVVGAVPCCSRRCASTCRPTIKPAPSVRVRQRAITVAPAFDSLVGVALVVRLAGRVARRGHELDMDRLAHHG